LWSPAAAQALAYRSPSLINQGFAGAPVNMDQVEAGVTPAVSAGGPLVAYGRAIGLEAGDELTLSLSAPDGKELARSEPLTLPRAQAQYMMFVGKKRPATGWAKGSYRASLVVRRAGKVALSQSWTVGL
jgi:hypothetical protein